MTNPATTIAYHPLGFTSAVDFLEFFDTSLNSGQRKLHEWQRWALDFLSDSSRLKMGQRPRFTLQDRLKLVLCAANGSGKDAYVIAGFVCFVLCCWPRYKQIITSSSYLQLDTQTRTYIRLLCESVNAYLKQNGIMDEDAIDIKTDTFTSTTFTKEDGARYSLTGGEVITFVTDEGGRAEGHHPWPDALPNEGVIIIINEGKSVPDEIYNHLNKCTYNYWIEISSAGEASKHFYNVLSTARSWRDEWKPNTYVSRTITSYDCPHKSSDVIEADAKEHGRESAFFRNTHLSEFVTTNSTVVITDTTYNKCLRTATSRVDVGLPRRAGLDLAGGGDECCLAVFDNNVQIAMECWRSKDTEATVDLLCGTATESGLFSKYGLLAENIYGDDNGLGQPIIDGCVRRNWNICRVRNQSKAFDASKYLNRGIELWVRFARLVEEAIVVLYKDEKLQKEFTNRHYETSEVQGKRKLLSKEEEKAQGFPSPNRADAVVLAFTGLTILDFTVKEKRVSAIPQAPPSQKTLVEAMDQVQARNATLALFIKQQQRLDLDDGSRANSFARSNPITVLQSLYD